MSLLARVNNSFQDYLLTEYEQSQTTRTFFVFPLFKLVISIWMIILVNQIITNYLVWIGLSLLLFIAAIGVQINIQRYLKMVLALGIIYPLIVGLPLIFITRESIVWSVSIRSLTISVSEIGLINARNFFFRIMCNTSIVLFLVLSTPFIHIIHVFHQLHLPKFITTIMVLTYRYFFLFFENLIKILRADDCRRFSKLPFKRRFNHIGTIFSMLLLRSMQRGTKIHRAMLARGYSGEIPDISYQAKLTPTILYLSSFAILNLLLFILFI
ncbi:cobalt ECF transporter T component CbiQ [Candidatus Lokiarchaeum ossiferum]|uniref:cobalt ECF transporter T component CbiQ n=1 Tax=Candidatus Lokiarchaeum ossiferum TaxID=2951803 RepID=UPI00352EC4B3